MQPLQFHYSPGFPGSPSNSVREVFRDDALRSLVEEALKNNYDVRTAAWHVEEFRARAGIARSRKTLRMVFTEIE